MRQQAFTLIELLIVIMLMALLMSLVGPVAINQYERTRLVEEREHFLRIVERAKADALNRRISHTLNFSENQISFSQHTETHVHTYQYLTFGNEKLTVNAHGYWQPETLDYLELTRQKTLALNPPAIELN
ncbi:hypothetical protein GCM10010919_17300 [Alishewanella longhuensis]|uniref:Prepilin-type N-terminal cleavage/methylation domain-containing protein n=1 Tax=Alishewanella longhuensis TaxID=1091037 RepID=A0ABQ3KZ40_9ALTE|nr:type II secretion system protein [Alishewanella longhuensis]GHG68115.1 hypothetical protein GCM10010919_17300 [Alishewanella longhuensis]